MGSSIVFDNVDLELIGCLAAIAECVGVNDGYLEVHANWL